jgi:hypothetical protein
MNTTPTPVSNTASARRSPLGHRLGWLALAAAVTATTTLGAEVVGAEQGRSGPPSTPAVDAPAETFVHLDDADVGLAYVACLREVSRSVDTQERWLDACRDLAVRRATVAAFEARCRDGVSRSADTLDAWTDACAQQAIRNADAQLAFVACMHDGATADAMERRSSGC